MSESRSWPEVSLYSFCNPKQWPTIPQTAFVENGYPVYGANGRIGYYTKFNHEKATVLITCRGATCGTINVCEPRSYVTGNSMALDDLDESQISLKYLVYALRHRSLAKAITGTAQPQITRESLTSVSIPLPPLNEQRRIAEILDKADEQRVKRRSAVAKLDTLTQSIFLDMFGDPRKKGSLGRTPTTPKLLGGLARIRTGKLDANAADDDGAYPFFTCAVEPLRINTPAFDCHAVLIAGNGDLNVKYYEGKFNAYQRTYVIESVDEAVLVPQFLYAFLELYVSELRKQAIGGVIKYIKLPYLTDAVVQLPSEEAQLEFAQRLRAAEGLKTVQRASGSELDALFSSLQHRAFRGEL